MLRDLIRQSINETVELKRFPTLQAEIAAAATRALEAFRDDSKKLATRLVDMEVRGNLDGAGFERVCFSRSLPARR